ncbi:hypothetical protein N665_1114s0007 [Sinapis alba]|nr:hypothetical protein N665_1114s0007 [Sinapis alba]
MLCVKLHIKKKYELWCLVGPEPARFSLIVLEHLTGLNCDYVENLKNPRCEVTEETTAFWQLLGVCIDAGPTTEQIIAACKRCAEWSQDDQMRLGYLAIFTGFIEGKKFLTVTRASLARLVMDLKEFENYPWGRVAFKVWVYYALPELGAEYGHPVQNKPSPSLMAYNGGKERRFFKDAIKIQSSGKSFGKSSHQTISRRLNYKSSVSRLTIVMNFVKKKDISEMWSKWDQGRKQHCKIYMEWEASLDHGMLGSRRYYLMVQSKVCSLVYEEGRWQVVDAMRDGFGMILREIKLVSDRVEVVADRVKVVADRVKALEQLAKTTEVTASNEAPHTAS